MLTTTPNACWTTENTPSRRKPSSTKTSGYPTKRLKPFAMPLLSYNMAKSMTKLAVDHHTDKKRVYQRFLHTQLRSPTLTTYQNQHSVSSVLNSFSHPTLPTLTACGHGIWLSSSVPDSHCYLLSPCRLRTGTKARQGGASRS